MPVDNDPLTNEENFLLAELGFYHSRWTHTTDVGQRQLDILVALVTGASGLFFFLPAGESPTQPVYVIVMGLVLFLWSAQTYWSLVNRSFTVIKYVRAINLIRARLVQLHPHSSSALLFPADPASPSANRWNRFIEAKSFAAVIAGALLGLVASYGLAAFRTSTPLWGNVAVGVVVGTLWLLLSWRAASLRISALERRLKESPEAA